MQLVTKYDALYIFMVFVVTRCINDIKHFIIQLMHTT